MYTAKRGPLGGVIRWAAMRKRLLLLIPTTTYRTEDFMEAAGRLDVDLVVASDRPNVMAGEFPESLLTLPFDDPVAAVAEMREHAARHPLDAVVPVDDVSAVAGAAIAGALGLRANPVAAVAATRDKLRMRELLAQARGARAGLHRRSAPTTIRARRRGACAIPACSSRSCSRRAGA